MIADLFAGPGGWDEALSMLGVTDTVRGYEWDEAACLTAEAAGHYRARGDLSNGCGLLDSDACGLAVRFTDGPCRMTYSARMKGYMKHGNVIELTDEYIAERIDNLIGQLAGHISDECCWHAIDAADALSTLLWLRDGS